MSVHVIDGVAWREVVPLDRDEDREMCPGCGNEWRACDCGERVPATRAGDVVIDREVM